MARFTVRAAVAMAAALAFGQGGPAEAQYGYPGGYGNYGWGGWGYGGAGGGASTVQGNVARGLGAYAAGAGYYNQQTAVARSINTDTVMRWNEYMYQSQKEANRRQWEQIARRQNQNVTNREKVAARLRDHPEARDIYQGDALNMALEQINDPRVYVKALSVAKTPIGGEMIRDIPFQYAVGMVTSSIHQVTQDGPPPALQTPAFAADRAQLKALGTEIRGELAKDDKADPALIDKAVALVNSMEAKVETTYAANTRQRLEADRYLKALHGLLGMLKTPALDFLLSGVEKRPEASLADLLTFMNSFNLHFGPATTKRQQAVYDALYPKLDALRGQVAQAEAGGQAAQANATGAAGDFFSAMPYEDLRKKAPATTPAPPK